MADNYNRNFGTSPNFKWVLDTSLSSSQTMVVDWAEENPRSAKYLPFNFTRVINNGEDDIWFYANQNDNDAHRIPAGTIFTFDSSSIPALSSFKIENGGSSTISSGKIVISNHNEGQDADSVVQRLHRRLVEGKKNKRVV